MSSLVLSVLHRAEAAVVSPLEGDVSPADSAAVVAPPSGSEQTGSLPSVDLVSRGVKSIQYGYMSKLVESVLLRLPYYLFFYTSKSKKVLTCTPVKSHCDVFFFAINETIRSLIFLQE